MRAKAAGLALAAALGLSGAPASANPSLSSDFTNMMGWLSHEMVQGLAFNAGETFDPPREITGLGLKPDLSLGVGNFPLDKRRFPRPRPRASGLQRARPFPSSVLFPVAALHLRMAFPGAATSTSASPT